MPLSMQTARAHRLMKERITGYLADWTGRREKSGEFGRRPPHERGSLGCAIDLSFSPPWALQDVQCHVSSCTIFFEIGAGVRCDVIFLGFIVSPQSESVMVWRKRKSNTVLDCLRRTSDDHTAIGLGNLNLGSQSSLISSY